MLTQDSALGSDIDRLFGTLKGRRIPSALSGRTVSIGCSTRGVAPGWHPPRRWREAIAHFQEKTSRDKNLPDKFRYGIGDLKMLLSSRSCRR